jgi:hypothetical protein
MFGLTPLYRSIHPDSTHAKISFLFEYAWTHMHWTTTVISFGALLILVAMRSIKGMFVKYWWIYRIPEVLVVVVASTCRSTSCPAGPQSPDMTWQYYRMNSDGTKTASRFWAKSPSIQDPPSFSYHSGGTTSIIFGKLPPQLCEYTIPS